MKTKPDTTYALLGAMMEGPMHGYEILRLISSNLGSTWRISTSQLYSLLKKLEERELLESKLEMQDTRPSKRVFSLTGRGREVFLNWLQSPTKHIRDLRIEFLAKLYFYDHLKLKGAERLVEEQLRLLEEHRESFRGLRTREISPYRRLVLAFKMATLDAWADWLIREARPFSRGAWKGA